MQFDTAMLTRLVWFGCNLEHGALHASVLAAKQSNGIIETQWKAKIKLAVSKRSEVVVSCL